MLIVVDFSSRDTAVQVMAEWVTVLVTLDAEAAVLSFMATPMSF